MVTSTMAATIYRPITEFDNLYASMDGSIVHGTKHHPLRQTLRKDGYLLVRIPNLKQVLAHRLVAAAFFGPCPEGMEVRHGEKGRACNEIDNLCYGSSRDNTQDAMRTGTHQGAIMAAKVECSRGHEYSAANTYVHPSTGSRHCRACRTDYIREYNAKPENITRRKVLRNKGVS